MRSFRELLNTDLTGPNKGKRKVPLSEDEKRARWKARRREKYFDFDLIKILMVLSGPLGFIYLLTGYQNVIRNRRVGLCRAIRMIVYNNAPLPDGLMNMSYDAPSFYIRSILRHMSDEMQQGTSLAETLHRFPKALPMHYIEQIQIAEETGHLVPVLDDIIHDLEINKGNFGNALININYIVYSLFIQLTIVSFLIIKVVPVFGEIFGEFGAGLPRSTQSLVNTSNTINYYLSEFVILWSFCGIGFVLLFILFLNSLRFRLFLYAWAIPIPILGRIMRFKQRLLIVESLETHIKAHVPLPMALERVSQLSLTRPYKYALQNMHERISSGHSVKETFSNNPYLMGHTFGTILTLGESAGTLGESCARLKDMYRNEISFRSALVVEAMIPTYAVIGGGLNCWILISLYSPIFYLSNIFLDTL